MDVLSPVLSFSPVISAAFTVVNNLLKIKAIKEHNEIVANEADLFINSIYANIDMLKEKLPNENGTWAIASLEEDLKKAGDYLGDCLKKGKIKAFWDAKKIAEELETLKKDLAHKFQVKLFITTLEVIIDADKRTEDFQSRMLQMFALSAAHNNAATTEIRNLLQPLVIGLRRQDANFQAFVNGIRQIPNEANFERESEIEKFIADVMANLEELIERQPPRWRQDDAEEFFDPFTGDLMIDPVKCKNGLTYCRFSVFRYNLSQRQPLVIVCDDVSVRGRLFERFHDQELDKKYKARRDAYKEEALRLADGGHCAEALDMLNNTLQWDDSDSRCIQMRKKMEETIATKNPLRRPDDDKTDVNTPEPDRRPTSAIDSQTDVNISELDRRPPSPVEPFVPEQPSSPPRHDTEIPQSCSPLDFCLTIWCCPCYVYFAIATYFGCLNKEKIKRPP